MRTFLHNTDVRTFSAAAAAFTVIAVLASLFGIAEDATFAVILAAGSTIAAGIAAARAAHHERSLLALADAVGVTAPQAPVRGTPDDLMDLAHAVGVLRRSLVVVK